ncbi:MAG TPA: nuclear transport factor 2 family protein [Terriglobales bacterium]|jgi:hypothetical protein|nr:nuclear transport factor 2 family protein [Terriglobales bacterium]
MKQNRLALSLLVSLFVLPSFALSLQTQVNARSLNDPRQEVIELERQAKEATLKRDADFSERTLSDDYMGITPLGQVINKADTITARRSGQLRYESIEITDMVVRVHGNIAIVTARADVRGHDLGEEFNGPYRYTRVWMRRNGKWQTVSYQATVTR